MPAGDPLSRPGPDASKLNVILARLSVPSLVANLVPAGTIATFSVGGNGKRLGNVAGAPIRQNVPRDAPIRLSGPAAASRPEWANRDGAETKDEKRGFLPHSPARK